MTINLEQVEKEFDDIALCLSQATTWLDETRNDIRIIQRRVRDLEFSHLRARIHFIMLWICVAVLYWRLSSNTHWIGPLVQILGSDQREVDRWDGRSERHALHKAAKAVEGMDPAQPKEGM